MDFSDVVEIAVSRCRDVWELLGTGVLGDPWGAWEALTARVSPIILIPGTRQPGEGAGVGEETSAPVIPQG